MEISVWKARLEREREEKDRFFAEHPQSPIPPEERKKFKGLDYYPLDSDYRFELELHEHDEKKLVKMIYTKGEEQEFLRWGEFWFKIGGKECRFQVYRRDSREETLFIPFKDATSGKETYGAGRYLDLRTEEDYVGDGKWILDFNKAYTPWCAYSEAYTCPFVLPENWLKVTVRAGEKSYPPKRESEEVIKQ